MLKSPKHKPDDLETVNSFTRYSSIAFKMLAVIGLGIFAGFQLDKFFNTQPIIIIILSLLSVSLAIYSSIRDFLK